MPCALWYTNAMERKRGEWRGKECRERGEKEGMEQKRVERNGGMGKEEERRTLSPPFRVSGYAHASIVVNTPLSITMTVGYVVCRLHHYASESDKANSTKRLTR